MNSAAWAAAIAVNGDVLAVLLWFGVALFVLGLIRGMSAE